MKTEEEPRCYIQRRFVVVGMLFWGIINYMIMRVNLSIAIIAMTQNTTTENGTLINAATFDWDTKQQGIILSAFYYGTVVIQLPAAMFAKMFSPTNVYALGVGFASLLTLLTPLLAVSFRVMVILRMLMGVASGVVFPVGMVILSNWAPPIERSRMTVMADSGVYIGMIIALQGGGVISEYFGWEIVFYITGSIGMLWCIIWTFFIKPTPSKDRRISEKEKNYILNSLPNRSNSKQLRVPWRKILKSGPCWAITIANIAFLWGLAFISTQMPTYLSHVFNFQLTKTGFFSCLPYILTASMSAPAGFLADYLQKKNFLKTVQVRKLFTCVPFIIKIGLLIALTFSESAIASVIFLMLVSAFDPFITAGYWTNAIEIAGPFSGIFIAIANTMGTSTGIITSTLTGLVVQDKTKEQWNIMFYTVASAYAIAAIVYGCLASSDLETWALKDIEMPEKDPEEIRLNDSNLIEEQKDVKT